MIERRGWGFVPLLYFLQGIPYVVVVLASVPMLKSMSLANPHLSIGNDLIAFWTTLIALPWTLKMLWGPLVDLLGTKRGWIVGTQLVLGLLMLVLAFSIGRTDFLTLVFIVLGLMAFISATHDIAADGFYLLALNKRSQAFFVGIRSTFYRLAMIFGSGVLVMAAGAWEARSKGELTGPDWLGSLDGLYRFAGTWVQGTGVDGTVAQAWIAAFILGAGVYLFGWFLNLFAMPRPADRPAAVDLGAQVPRVPALEAISAFFRQKKILWILLFILFYRFGESLIGKVSALFLMDPTDRGGLGLSTLAVGRMTGTIGVVALLAGGLLGGFLIARFGIKKCLWPMVLSLNIPNFFYIWAAMTRPEEDQASILIAVDQFGYGFGFSAYMVYLMMVSRGTRYPTSSYAVATGLMALGALMAGTISGWLQVQLGYVNFFIAVCLLGIPGIITLFFIPLEGEDIRETVKVD